MIIQYSSKSIQYCWHCNDTIARQDYRFVQGGMNYCLCCGNKIKSKGSAISKDSNQPPEKPLLRRWVNWVGRQVAALCDNHFTNTCVTYLTNLKCYSITQLIKK